MCELKTYVTVITSYIPPTSAAKYSKKALLPSSISASFEDKFKKEERQVPNQFKQSNFGNSPGI
jgi:hypothetical protein